MRPKLIQIGALLLIVSLYPAARASMDFGPWPDGKSPEVIGRRLTERFIAKTRDKYYTATAPKYTAYPEVCAWYGALGYVAVTQQTQLRQALLDRFEPLVGDRAALIPPVLNVDYAVFGALPLELAIQTGEKRFLELGLRIARAQWAAPNEAELGQLAPEQREIALDAVQRGLTWHTRYWIDDMFMITLLQAQAHRASGDAVFIDRAAREMVDYLDHLQEPNGLFHHAPDVPFFWSRGNGWFAAGMAELLSSLPEDHPLRGRIMAGYQKMMTALLGFQGGDGLWPQLVDKPESWSETSGTGMFLFAFVTGVKKGWLDADRYTPAIRKGWLALVGRINEQADVQDVCEGTNKKNDYQYYLDRRRLTGDWHGQAPALWCATAMLR